jgi:putative heme-binding domain-containing protein
LGRTLSAQGRLNAVWAATRIDDPKAREIVRNALQDPDETVRQAAAHSASIWRDHDSLSLLLDMLANGTPPNRRVAAEAIGRIGNPRAIKPLLAALATPTDRVLDHSLTFALIEIDDARATAEGLKSSNPHVQRATLMALDQMENSTLEPATVAAELNAKDPDLREAAAWIAARHKDWGSALATVLRDQLANSTLGATDLAQLQQQLAALAGSPAIADLLIDRLQDPSATDPQRRIILGAMRDSRVKQVPVAWKEALFHQLKSGDATVVADCVASISQLSFAKEDVATVDAELRTTGERTDLPASTRLAALSAIHAKLAKLSRPFFDFIVSQLTTNPSPSDRIAAAQVLGHATLDTDEQLAATELLRTAGPLEIDPLLKAFDRAKNSSVGMKLVAALKQARSLRSLHADVLKLRLKNFGPEVQQEAGPLFAQLSPDAGKQKARLDQLLATLPPGDIRRGQLLFNGTKASCFACHSIGYVGGHVGPDLTRIGQIRAERDLLESIVFPSASFVQSFEPVMVETTDGERQYGIVRKNDAEEVMLVTGPNLEVHIPRSKLKRMLPGAVSLMPDGFDQVLAPQELADLVAFLRACR